MEGPLLTKSEHNVTIHGDPSSNDEHNVDITTNGDSSSADEQTPHEAVQSSDPSTNGTVWILVQFVVTLVQIVAAIFLLTLTKDEQHSQKIYVTLIIGYTLGCIPALPVIGWLFWHFNQSVRSETRIVEVMYKLYRMLEYFFVGWVAILLWHLIDNASSLDYTTPHFWLCLAFLAISCILYVIPNYICAGICFLYPMIVRLTQVLDWTGDLENKLMYISLAVLSCIGILICLCGICTSVRGRRRM